MAQEFGFEPPRKFSLTPKLYLPAGECGSTYENSVSGIFQTIGSRIQSNDFAQFSYEIKQYLDHLHRYQSKKQLIEINLKSLVQILVTFPLPIILVFYNNAIRSPPWYVYTDMSINSDSSRASYCTAIQQQKTMRMVPYQ